jgi:hypothetical protein
VVRTPPAALKPARAAAPLDGLEQDLRRPGVALTFTLPVEVFRKSAPPSSARSAATPISAGSASSPVSRIAFSTALPQAAFTARTQSVTGAPSPAISRR